MAVRAEAIEREPIAADLPSHVDIVIVGSGFAGLAAAIALATEGREFVVLEKASDLGGTWRDNSYPGCECDVPSHLYSFSFAPNPDWTQAFSPQEEIYDYLKRTARDAGILPRIRFDAEVRSARWDAGQQRWQLETARGPLSANILISGTGGLSEPAIPNIPGLESFAGTTFHSATWRHDHDLTGKRVAVIGTGASAIQFVPHVQSAAAHMTLFQRTAPWVLPRRDRSISRLERWIYRHIPGAQRVARSAIYWSRETWIVGFAMKPDIMRFVEKQALRFLHKQVPDPVLRKKLRPHYRLGCKRVLMSNTYYPALTQPNVHVETDPIVEVLPEAIVTADAEGNRVEHPVDTIIFGTGFHVTDPPVAERVWGRDGRTLREHWSSTSMSALHGIAIAGFPNLFFLVGPNTGLGHTSIVLMIEAQVRYLVDGLRQMKRHGVGEIEPRLDVQDLYNARLQKDLQKTVWNAGGCASWYLDERGRNTTLWPTFTFMFRKELHRFDPANYEARPPHHERSHASQLRGVNA
ncbi:MAG TPA: NAD(P)/FAD-dependent oxidoreductase [Actinomycetota bacterium]|nr:NAD(P)/FAD-dependent oxidoreductase [Actinomycetota bacterium]